MLHREIQVLAQREKRFGPLDRARVSLTGFRFKVLLELPGGFSLDVLREAQRRQSF
jgi:hypothetical protein